MRLKGSGVREVTGSWVEGASENGCMEVKDCMKGSEGGGIVEGGRMVKEERREVGGS